MASYNDEYRKEIIDKVISYVHDKVLEEEAKVLEKFVHFYFLSASTEDLISRSVIDLYGAAVSHWKFIYQHQKQSPKVSVYNPKFEEQREIFIKEFLYKWDGYATSRICNEILKLLNIN